MKNPGLHSNADRGETGYFVVIKSVAGGSRRSSRWSWGRYRLTRRKTLVNFGFLLWCQQVIHLVVHLGTLYLLLDIAASLTNLLVIRYSLQ
ncbi:MAG: hypothetical protein ACRCWC_06100, partial [Plesiomonas shigelloides]